MTVGEHSDISAISADDDRRRATYGQRTIPDKPLATGTRR